MLGALCPLQIIESTQGTRDITLPKLSTIARSSRLNDLSARHHQDLSSYTQCISLQSATPKRRRLEYQFKLLVELS
jgi:hypothetical protein